MVTLPVGALRRGIAAIARGEEREPRSGDRERRNGGPGTTRRGNVEVRDAGVEEISGERGAFEVRLTAGKEQARRVLLCTGMIDELPDVDGLKALWGTSTFQCPYGHGWEAQDRRFAYLAAKVEMLDFALLLRGWSRDVVALTDGRYDVSTPARQRLESAAVPIDERRITRLAAKQGRLEYVEFAEGGPASRPGTNPSRDDLQPSDTL